VGGGAAAMIFAPISPPSPGTPDSTRSQPMSPRAMDRPGNRASSSSAEYASRSASIAVRQSNTDRTSAPLISSVINTLSEPKVRNGQ